MKKQFSIAGLLLVVFVAALIVSQVVLSGRLSDSQSTLREVHRQNQMIFVDDPSRLYLLQLGETGDIFRVHLPPGADYVLHLADTIASEDGFPSDPTPTKTIAFGDTTDGFDTILHLQVARDPNNRGIARASINDRESIEYVIQNWTDVSQPKRQHVIDAREQLERSSSDSINLMWWRDPSTNRMVTFWMEPRAIADARAETNETTEPSDEPKSR